MTEVQEREMHAIAVHLEELTRDAGWEGMRYAAIGQTLEQLAEYCRVAPPTVYLLWDTDADGDPEQFVNACASLDAAKRQANEKLDDSVTPIVWQEIAGGNVHDWVGYVAAAPGRGYTHREETEPWPLMRIEEIEVKR